MLFPKAILNAILKAEWEADAPLPQALGITRRAEKEKKRPTD
jgi:hypothetical protein